jgi:hypothetical protein
LFIHDGHPEGNTDRSARQSVKFVLLEAMAFTRASFSG